MHYYGKADRSEDIFDFEPTDDEDDQQSRQRTFAIRISIRKLGFRKKPLPITQSLSQSGPRWRTDGRCRINARVGQI